MEYLASFLGFFTTVHILLVISLTHHSSLMITKTIIVKSTVKSALSTQQKLKILNQLLE